MPYDIAKPDALPDNVKKMTADQQKQWVEVFNSPHASCTKDGGKDCEGEAMAKANGVIKAGKKNALQIALRTVMEFFESVFGAEESATPISDNKARALALSDLFRQVCDEAFKQYPQAWLMDVYEDSGTLFALFSFEGLLYRALITITNGALTLGDLVQVETQFADVPGGTVYAAPPAVEGTPYEPMDDSGDMIMNSVRSSTTIIRQADGRTRWFSVSCTAVLNRVGEIDSTALFDSFVENFNSAKFPPVIRQFFHAGAEYRVGVVDFVARDGKTLITSGLYDDTELARAEIAAREAEPEYWGQSIGYDPTTAPTLLRVADGISIPTYTAGVLREESTLPERQAAALFTTTHTMEVIRMLNTTQFEAFVKLFGGDETKARAWLAEHPDATNRMIDQAGMIARGTPPATTAAPEAETPAASQAAPAAAPAPTPEATTAEPVTREFEIDDEALTAIAERLTARPEFQALLGLPATLAELSGQISSLSRDGSARAQEIQKRLAALEKDDTIKRDEWLADLPPALRTSQRTRLTYRPREAHASETQAEGVEASQLAEATLAGAKTRNTR